MNKELNTLIENTIHQNHLIKINDQLYLKQYQIDILELNHIPYQNCSSVAEILLLIEDALEDSDGMDESLDDVAKELQEFHYYHNTNK